jgi:HK97 family phage major capsid protein
MTNVTKLEAEARAAYEAAVEKLDEQDSRIQALPENIDDTEREFHNAVFADLAEEVARAKETWERQTAIAKARRAVAPASNDEEDERNYARPTGGKHEVTYRQDRDYSFFRDLYYGPKGDSAAAGRLSQHAMETRDVSTADPGAGVFVPPKYLGELWAELPRESRPFASRLRQVPLPDGGMNVTIPRLTTGATVAVQQTQADAPSETDVDGTLLTVNVNTIAGQQDLSIQALERTFPGMDQIVFQDLRAAYDGYLDTQCLQGTGSNAQHLGIAAVSGRNTVTWTTSTGTPALFLPKVYDAIQQIADGRKANPDLIVMHPRRAAWIASGLSSTFPLFQQGQLNQAAGTQDGGFLRSFAGLEVIVDSNVVTTNGAGTNEDKVYIVRSSDLILMEGPIRARALEQTLGNTLQVKLQVFAYSAFVSGRQPEAIGEVVGTGLATPAF